MQVKVGDTTYSDRDHPIAIYLEDKDLVQIAKITPRHENRAYASFPRSLNWNREQRKAWVEGRASVDENNASNTDQNE